MPLKRDPYPRHPVEQVGGSPLISLARRGVHADAVIGHSSGEIATAYAAGPLSLAEAATISYYRGFVMREFSQAGAMAAINLPASDIQPLLAEGVVIAAENSPRSTTILGDTAAVERTISLIRDQHPDIFCRKLAVDTAYHSHHMVSPAARYHQHLVDELGTW
jgi:acyl transferase domain-containing protein